jgi:hypothetical protein
MQGADVAKLPFTPEGWLDVEQLALMYLWLQAKRVCGSA